MLKISVSYTAKSVTLVSPCCCSSLERDELSALWGWTETMYQMTIYPQTAWWANDFPGSIYLSMGDWNQLHHPNTYSAQAVTPHCCIPGAPCPGSSNRVFTLPLLTAFITVGGREPCKSCNFLTFLGLLSFSSFLSFMSFLLPTRSECFNLVERATKHSPWNIIKHCPTEYIEPPF